MIIDCINSQNCFLCQVFVHLHFLKDFSSFVFHWNNVWASRNKGNSICSRCFLTNWMDFGWPWIDWNLSECLHWDTCQLCTSVIQPSGIHSRESLELNKCTKSLLVSNVIYSDQILAHQCNTCFPYQVDKWIGLHVINTGLTFHFIGWSVW